MHSDDERFDDKANCKFTFEIMFMYLLIIDMCQRRAEELVASLS